MKTSKQLEEEIDNQVEVYATRFSNTSEREERQYEENPQETYRTSYRRDRDRILYSKSFRHLQFKTQVFVNSVGDNYRTRLAHSMEVEQLATSIAKALSLNEDLVSAIAYGHDLGHTPFGHAIERKLDELMKDCGGFSHSVQSVRVVEFSEEYRKQDYPGLNLCWTVREGILKHNKDKYTQYQQHDCQHLLPEQPGSLESQVVYYCDKLAYRTHDLEDAIKSGLVDILLKDGFINQIELEELWGEFGLIYNKHGIRDIIRVLVTDFIEGSTKKLQEAKISGNLNLTADIKKWENLSLLTFKDKKKAYEDLGKFLNRKIYDCKYIVDSDNKAQEMIEVLFKRYCKETSFLPDLVQEQMKNCSCSCPKRIIVDYISGMTDRYASDQFKRLYLFQEYEKTWR